MSKWTGNVRLWNIFWGLFVAALVGGIIFVAVFVLPEALWWHNRRGLLVITSAKDLAISVESFRTEQGRYPQTAAEYRTLTRQGTPTMSLIDSIIDASKRAGCPLTEVVVAKEGFGRPGRPLLVISGQRGRVEIYPSGRIGVSACFRPRTDSPPPEWLVVLPNEPWPG